jgi:hypothetical protein
MGTARKVTLLLIRFGEIVCGAVVLGILGAFCERVRSDGATVDGRIIYAMVVSGITIVYSLMSCALLKFQFLIFPFDFVLFIMWLVAFSLLASVRTAVISRFRCQIAANCFASCSVQTRKPEHTLVVPIGTTITGATIGAAFGDSVPSAQSASLQGARNGGRFLPFLS